MFDEFIDILIRILESGPLAYKMIIVVGVASVISALLPPLLYAVIKRYYPDFALSNKQRAILGMVGLCFIVFGTFELMPYLELPEATVIIPDKTDHLTAFSDIKWTAIANDPQRKPLYYRFWRKGPSTDNKPLEVRPWASDNTWLWHTTAGDVGLNIISVNVTNKNPPPPTGLEVSVGNSSYIDPFNSEPSIKDLTSSRSSPQIAGVRIRFEVVAEDPDPQDQLQYRFWHSGNSTNENYEIGRDWSQSNYWTWNTSEKDIGDNWIKVYVIDDHHNGRNATDDNRVDAWKKIQFTITSNGNKTNK